MSREVRRVPLGWKHPVEYNPYWIQRSSNFLGEKRPTSRLHAIDERFIPLYEGPYSQREAEWFKGETLWSNGAHSTIAFLLNYHSPEGYLNHQGIREEPRPYEIFDIDEETVLEKRFFTCIQDVLDVYPTFASQESKPNSKDYMPDFLEEKTSGVPFGYCLYEAVSEGTPVTPVFATEAELINWLTTMGQDYDQVPLRLESATALVKQGWSLGSAMVVNNELLDSTIDADIIEALGSK